MSLQNSEQAIKEKDSQIKENLLKIHQISDDRIVNEQNLQQEILSQKNLISSQKNSIEELNFKLNDLKEKYSKLVERSEKVQSDHLIVELEKTKEELEKLKKTEKTRHIVEDTRELLDGLSLTEVYEKYVDVSDQLLKEKDETGRLNEVLNQILIEVQLKVPLIQTQKDDYEKLLSSHATLSKKYQKLLYEYERDEKDLSELKEQIKNEKEKGKFYEEENNALSKQVGNLLKENNDLKKGKR